MQQAQETEEHRIDILHHLINKLIDSKENRVSDKQQEVHNLQAKISTLKTRLEDSQTDLGETQRELAEAIAAEKSSSSEVKELQQR